MSHKEPQGTKFQMSPKGNPKEPIFYRKVEKRAKEGKRWKQGNKKKSKYTGSRDDDSSSKNGVSHYWISESRARTTKQPTT